MPSSPNAQPPNTPQTAQPTSPHPYNGFINLHKSAGWTSHDCVAKVRRLLGMKKVGHAGTLDPAATGVLPIALGRATRLLQYLPTDKAYRAVVRFGLTTDTDDLEGQVLTQAPAPQLTLDDIQAQLPQFIGEIRQVPPRYSAIQVKGQRLYDLARQGKTVEVPERSVIIHALTITDWQAGDQPELSLDIACGPGTYIRSIARDLGASVGTGATLAQLERTKSSGFVLSKSLSLESITQQLADNSFSPLPPEMGVQSLPAIRLDAASTPFWCQGRRPLLTAEQQLNSEDTIVRVIDPDGCFLGIGEIQPLDSTFQLSHRMVYAQPPLETPTSTD
ncbi:MAG: tRNA pseudouridine(55) synthase TruB [Cyanobacteria bacterium P01_A01_bin.105]